MNNGTVNSQTEQGVATITFSHPQSNSLPGLLLHELAKAITAAGNNSAIRVIVIKSEGEKTFCAGASFDELTAIKDVEAGKAFFSGFAYVINAMRNAPKFIIARVQGKAVGGGVGIASAADYTLAANTASIKLSELAVGIGPFVVGPAVERKLGNSAFYQLAINATEWQSAQWAKDRGLYAAVFDNLVDLDKAVADLTLRLAASNPDAMRLIKQMAWKGTENWDTLLFERAEISGKLVVSDFTRNAIEQFKAGAR